MRHIQESETLNREIPTYIHVGMFWVNCDSIKSILRKDLSKVVLDLYARKTSKVAVGISSIFSGIQQKLRERPSKIEELVELRDYLKTIPEIMEVQKSRISDMLLDFEKLEKFRYELANEDFKAKWLAFSWPAKIEELVTITKEQLANVRAG